MDKIKRRAQTRQQTALDRLGTNTPRCVECGETDWRCLEAHHLAGRAYDDSPGSFAAIAIEN
jgi:hypothetical protein